MIQTAQPQFRLYPAIDLVDGRTVRLLQGQFDRILTSEQDDALLRAELVWEAGAAALHVIDLDAARTGAPAEPNDELEYTISIQSVGGRDALGLTVTFTYPAFGNTVPDV